MAKKNSEKQKLWDTADEHGLVQGKVYKDTKTKWLTNTLKRHNVGLPGAKPPEKATPPPTPPTPTPSPLPSVEKKPKTEITHYTAPPTDVENLRQANRKQEALIISLKQQRDSKAVDAKIKTQKLNKIEEMLRARKYSEEILEVVFEKQNVEGPMMKAKVRINSFIYNETTYIKGQTLKVPVSYFPTSSLDLLEELPGELAKLQKVAK